METASKWRLDWDESLSVYIPEIDSEHRHFIELINGLNQSIIERYGMEEIKSRLQSILDDAAEHFVIKEALFDCAGVTVHRSCCIDGDGREIEVVEMAVEDNGTGFGLVNGETVGGTARWWVEVTS